MRRARAALLADVGVESHIQHAGLFRFRDISCAFADKPFGGGQPVHECRSLVFHAEHGSDDSAFLFHGGEIGSPEPCGGVDDHQRQAQRFDGFHGSGRGFPVARAHGAVSQAQDDGLRISGGQGFKTDHVALRGVDAYLVVQPGVEKFHGIPAPVFPCFSVFRLKGVLVVAFHAP